LYAAGELGSLFAWLYEAGGGLAECIVFGKIAGLNAAAEKPVNSW
jgi:succinate dehydrogenase/fumarate reductase flavoprotein subunit